MLPFIVRLLVEPGLLPTTMALWVLLFLLLIVSTAKNLHHSTIKVFNLTREKNRLLEQVNLRNEELSVLNAELVEARDSAEAAARAKSQFLANMSHEIRTPMHGVLGMAQVLKCTRIDEHQQHYLEILQRSGETLLALLDDVLDLAKIESGEIGLHPEIVEMEKWHEDMQVLLRPLFNGSDVAFHYRIKEGMPKALLVDRTRLTQIVVNLVANAAKFTKQGEVILSISGEYLNKKNLKLKLEVKDTGIGMPGDQLDVIFNNFYQLNQARVYDKGAGLGLAITQKIAEAMDTVLMVDSVVGKGSCFGVDIV
ncbi:MAG: hypothetical protein GWN00_30545, partial [Aliifodinibius sp.]|nr:hypothetical protein [Fodinibius sp.]NIV15133.1 hypothetical protein [Fodinibius sp.]NIY28971.1 hypothetical protein [Fodinibius sp.]